MSAPRPLSCEVFLAAPVERVFAFFAEAENLEGITPPWLRFRVLSPGPIAMEEGTRIAYRLRLRGVPLHWVSVIARWDPPRAFVDEQLVGPYRLWRHEHRFRPHGGGTLVRDRVAYRVPGGAPVERLLVRPDLERIFRYRSRMLLARFGGGVCGRPASGKTSR